MKLDHLIEQKLKANLWKIAASDICFKFGLIAAIYILFFRFLGFSFNDIGIYEAVTSIAIVLFDLPTGSLADFIGRKWTVFIANLFMLSFALLLGFSNGGMAIFVIAGILSGLEFSFKSGAKTALLYDTLKEMKREKEFLKISGKINAFSTISAITGMIIGSYLFTLHPRLPILLWAVFIGFSCFFMAIVHEPKHYERKYSLKNTWLDMKRSVKFIFRKKQLLWVTLFFLLAGIFMECYWDVFSQAHLTASGLNPALLGIVFAVFAGFNAFGSYYAHRIEKFLGEKKSMYTIIIAEAILFILMAIISLPIALIVCLVFLTTNREFAGLVEDHYSNRHIPSKNRASILSAASFLNNGLFGGGLMIWLFGLSIDKLGGKITLISAGLIVFILGIFMLQMKYRKNK